MLAGPQHPGTGRDKGRPHESHTFQLKKRGGVALKLNYLLVLSTEVPVAGPGPDPLPLSTFLCSLATTLDKV